MMKNDRNTLFLSLGYGLLITLTLREYLVVDATFVVGLAVLPLCFNTYQPKDGEQNRIINHSFRYLFWLIPTLILTVLTHSYTFFYLMCVGAIMLVWETRMGKQSALPPILLLIISPIFRYITDVFTFDFRLKLTEIAAFILQKMTPSVSAVGNLVKLEDGSEWQIDEACMGLNMLGVSLILSIFFIAHFSNKQKKQPSQAVIALILGVTLTLNILCNLLRIIALVHFKIVPHTMGHDMVGLLALAIYTIVPMFFLVKKMASYNWFFKVPTSHKAEYFWKNQTAVNAFVFVILFINSAFLIYQKRDATATNPPEMTLKGFQKNTFPNGICQFSNDSLLIYVKPLQSFYTTEHSPMICWKGSGYAFQKIEKTKVGNAEIYTGVLSKGDSTIHAAWWFENEKGERTVDQMKWRWSAFTEGVHFRLVNVNAANLVHLQQFINKH